MPRRTVARQFPPSSQPPSPSLIMRRRRPDYASPPTRCAPSCRRLLRSWTRQRRTCRPAWGSARSCLEPSPGRFAASRTGANSPATAEKTAQHEPDPASRRRVPDGADRRTLRPVRRAHDAGNARTDLRWFRRQPAFSEELLTSSARRPARGPSRAAPPGGTRTTAGPALLHSVRSCRLFPDRSRSCWRTAASLRRSGRADHVRGHILLSPPGLRDARASAGIARFRMFLPDPPAAPSAPDTRSGGPPFAPRSAQGQLSRSDPSPMPMASGPSSRLRPAVQAGASCTGPLAALNKSGPSGAVAKASLASAARGRALNPWLGTPHPAPSGRARTHFGASLLAAQRAGPPRRAGDLRWVMPPCCTAS